MTDKVICEICGAEEHSIQLHLKKKHEGVSLDDYVKEYPDAKLLSELAIKKVRMQKEKMAGASAALIRPEFGDTKKGMETVFGLGKAKAALSARGKSIPISVMSKKGEFSDLIPEIDDRYIFPIDVLKNVLLGIEESMPVYLWGHAGVGKCLGKGTQVMLYNGATRVAEDIKVGDLLMGPDSFPRRVSSITNGVDDLYRVTPTKGDSYVVNSEHILSLKTTNNAEHYCGETSNSIVNIRVKDYLKKPKCFKNSTKGWRTGVEFLEQSEALPVESYFLGAWLGDGTSVSSNITTMDDEIRTYLSQYAMRLGLGIREDKVFNHEHVSTISICKKGGKKHSHPLRDALKKLKLIGDKHIPHIYKTSSTESRLNVLAGVIDTDGSLSQNCYDLILKSETLMDDVIFIARSLGFSAYKKSCKKTCTTTGYRGKYFRICISGDIDKIPCKIKRKIASPRVQKKSVLSVGIKVESIGRGDYFGFSIQGGSDRLFLLGDFTVTHNSTIYEQICARTNRPYVRIQHTANTEECHIVGQILANDKGTYFEPGELALAMKHGFIYNADEYDYAHASVLAVYQAVLEGKPLVIKEAPSEWRVVKPHKNFRFVATGNTNGSGDEHGIYNGTNMGNAANYSRFQITDNVTYMDPEIESRVVSSQSGIDKDDSDKLIEFAGKIRRSFEAGDMTATIGPRELIGSAKLGLRKASWRAGIDLAFTNRLSPIDREVSDGIAQRVFG